MSMYHDEKLQIMYYSYDDVHTQLQDNERKIIMLTRKNIENGIMWRFQLKQHKKNIKQLKYNIFLNRTMSPPNLDKVKELKNKLILLKNDKTEINSRFDKLYVQYVRDMEFCYGERMTYNMMLTSINAEYNRNNR